MAILNGSLGMISVDGVVLMNLTSVDISQEMATRDVTTKTSAGNKEVLEGMMSWSGSASGFFANEDGTGHKKLLAVLQARAAVALLYTEYNATGTQVISTTNLDAYDATNYTGNIFVTSISRTDGLEDSATFEVSFEGTGALTAGTNT